MNRIYRLVWSRATQSLIAVAENSRSSGKAVSAGRCGAAGSMTWSKFPTVRTLSLALALAYTGAAHAQPQGGQVAAGSGTISQSPNSTVVQQSSQHLAINWQSFGIGAGQSVQFQQPSSSSIVLNRVLGTDPSQILGSLSANGQVFIVNPNGVLFGAGAQVNVGGLVATTNAISDADFMAGNHRFTNSGTAASVVNRGTLTAADGGYIALLAPEVRNEGVITARLGTALLAAGNQVTLNLNNGSLVGYNIDQGAIKALADNKHLIQADGGRVLMSAKAADALSTAVVNNTGVIEARTFENRSGTIVLLGDMALGQVNVGGTLDASAPNGGHGGFIETSAAKVSIAGDVRVTTQAPQDTTGTWLIDPTDFTIAAGTAAQTTSGIGAATLSTALGTGNVSIATDTAGVQNGDIHVNSAVSWSANKLTLTAHGNININANLNGSGAAQLALKYGQSTAAGTGSGYFVKNGAKVNLPAGVNFSTRQGSAGATLGYTVITALGAQGSTSMTDLQGINGGLAGRYVLGADIDAAVTAGWNNNAGFAPLGTSATRFTGHFDGLGHTISGLVINRPATDNVGLFGYTDSGSSLRNVGLVGGSVIGAGTTGFLAGHSASTVNNVYATGNVTGGSHTGGLIGINGDGTISNAHTTGNTTGSADYTGGLVGTNSGNVSNVYTTGSTIGKNYAGGLAGMHSSGHVGNAYTTGNVTATMSSAGGLVGYSTSSISNACASGKVESPGGAGGLVALEWGGSISNSYWDVTTTGQATSFGSPASAGLTTAQLLQQASYTGFDFSNIWWISGGDTRPFLRSEYSASITNAHQLQLIAMNLAGTYTLANNIDMFELSRASGMWNTATGFVPLGIAEVSLQFTGHFDGLGHTINGLVINRPATDNVGLFGSAGTGTLIRNVGLVGGSVTGRSNTGSLVGAIGSIGGVNISNVYATGSVTGTTAVGGLMGNSYSNISNAYATGNVTGTNLVGGLVGNSNGGTISNSYATGNVHGGTAGGLVGRHGRNIGFLRNVYATGIVTGSVSRIGGLVGENAFSGRILDAYSTDSINPLIGVNISDGDITNTYTTGRGVFGYNEFPDMVSNSYWNVTTSGLASSDSGGTGITTAQMMSAGTFTGWSIATGGGSSAVWRIYEGQTGPLLRSFLTGITLADTSVTYNGATQAGSAVPTAGTLTGTAAIGRNAGVYAAFSNQQGYDISGGKLTIGKRVLTVSATGTNKVYDGSTTAAATLTDDRVAGDALTIASTGATFTDKTAGTGKTANVAGISVTGADAANYTFNTTAATTADITQRALTVTASAVSKVYDGANIAAATFADNRIAGDTLELTSAGATFNDKNVGTGKTVNATGINVTGFDAANYTFNTTAATTADITPKALALSGLTLGDKIYDGTTTASATAGLTGVIAGDTVSHALTASFADRNAGAGKTVTVTGVTLSGADGSNYTVTAGQAGAADITRKALTVTANDSSKWYDGIAYAGSNGAAINGFVNGETVAVLSGLLRYGGSSQGAISAGNYLITPNGLSSGNYSIAFVDGTLTISPVNSTMPLPNLTRVALGGTALVQPYNAAQQGVGNSSGLPGSSFDMQAAGNALSGSSNNNGTQITPNLSLAGCGMQLPADAIDKAC